MRGPELLPSDMRFIAQACRDRGLMVTLKSIRALSIPGPNGPISAKSVDDELKLVRDSVIKLVMAMAPRLICRYYADEPTNLRHVLFEPRKFTKLSEPEIFAPDALQTYADLLHDLPGLIRFRAAKRAGRALSKQLPSATEDQLARIDVRIRNLSEKQERALDQAVDTLGALRDSIKLQNPGRELIRGDNAPASARPPEQQTVRSNPESGGGPTCHLDQGGLPTPMAVKTVDPAGGDESLSAPVSLSPGLSQNPNQLQPQDSAGPQLDQVPVDTKNLGSAPSASLPDEPELVDAPLPLPCEMRPVSPAKMHHKPVSGVVTANYADGWVEIDGRARAKITGPQPAVGERYELPPDYVHTFTIKCYERAKQLGLEGMDPS